MQRQLDRMLGAPRGHVSVKVIEEQAAALARMQSLQTQLDHEFEEHPRAALDFRIRAIQKKIADKRFKHESTYRKQQYFACWRCWDTHKGPCAPTR